MTGAGDDGDSDGVVFGDLFEQRGDAEVAGLGQRVEFLGDGDGDDGDIAAFCEGDGGVRVSCVGGPVSGLVSVVDSLNGLYGRCYSHS